jgi:hypothetical protein
MRKLLGDLQPHESVLSLEILHVLAAGFVEEQGCVLLASQAHNSAFTRVADTHDETGYECFINHLHIESLQEALELAQRLTNTLTERFKSGFAVIIAFDGSEATVRFHKLRPGQTWLSDNLEGYEEGIAVLSSN